MSVAVMISYPSEKVEIAREVFKYLRGLGLTPWFDKVNLVGGDDWGREIAEALSAAELFVVISSADTIKKVGMVQRELNKIIELTQNQPIGSNFIINLRTESIGLPAELSRYQWIDTFDNDWRSNLLRALLKRFTQLGRDLTSEMREAVAKLERESEIEIRAIKVSDDRADYNSSYFTYSDRSDYWLYVNAEIVAHVYRQYYSARGDFGSYEPDRKFEWVLNCEEFFREQDLLSLRWHWFQDSGGAHPSHGTKTMNFVGQTHGFLSLSHLFSYSDEVISYINRYAQLDIKRQLLAVGHQDDIDFDIMLTGADLWDVYGEFNINEKGILFNLSPYSVLPYAFGSYEIQMPWDYFQDKINESFKGSNIARLIGARFN